MAKANKMATKSEVKTEQIIIPVNLIPFTDKNLFKDKKTLVKTAAFPIQFQDGIAGILSLTKFVKMDWHPNWDVSEIVIKFKE